MPKNLLIYRHSLPTSRWYGIEEGSGEVLKWPFFLTENHKTCFQSNYVPFVILVLLIASQFASQTVTWWNDERVLCCCFNCCLSEQRIMPIITLISSSSVENSDYVDPSLQLSYFLFYAGNLIAQSLNWVLFRVLKQGWLIQNSLFTCRCYCSPFTVLCFSKGSSGSCHHPAVVQESPLLLSPTCCCHLSVHSLNPQGVHARPRSPQIAGYF